MPTFFLNSNLYQNKMAGVFFFKIFKDLYLFYRFFLQIYIKYHHDQF